jgi:hypothetical protein
MQYECINIIKLALDAGSFPGGATPKNFLNPI